MPIDPLNTKSFGFVDNIIRIMDSVTIGFAFGILVIVVPILLFIYKLWTDHRNDDRLYNEKKKIEKNTIDTLQAEIREIRIHLNEYRKHKDEYDVRTQKQIEKMSEKIEKIMDLVIKLYSNDSS